jgi:mono/diheme cytochrome c family protein
MRRARHAEIRERCSWIVQAVLLIVVGLLAVAAAAEHESPPNQPLVDGKSLFASKGCVNCHRIWGEGEGSIGPDLGRNASWHDVMQLAGTFWNHAPAMVEQMNAQHIERPTFSPAEMGTLAAYLLYLNFINESGDATRGRTLFEQHSCARCHQFGGQGGTAGPRLDELSGVASSLLLAQALWNHGPDMAAKMAELKIERRPFAAGDVADMVAYLRGDKAPASLAEAAPQAGSPRAGQALFQQKGCAKCHAVDGVGGTVGPDFAKRPPIRHMTEMAGALWNHGPAMWGMLKEQGVAFPRLSDREMADVLAYIYFVQYASRRGDAAKGATLFQEKSCAQCHGADGAGVPADRSPRGPNLLASGTLRSPFSWSAAIWNQAPGIAQKFHGAQLPWPRFADDEMRDVVAFLQSRAAAK